MAISQNHTLNDMSNYIPVLYMDAIIYPCRNPDAGLAKQYVVCQCVQVKSSKHKL